MALNHKATRSTDALSSMADEASAPSAIDLKEQAHVETLTSFMPATDKATALRVLRKHHGDIERAAAALCEGDTAIEVKYTAPARSVSPRSGRRAGHGSPVIDLTVEEDDEQLARALKASLETVNEPPPINAVKFGPSTRAPDPMWAMVPSNVATPGLVNMATDEVISHEDRTLQRVMQESLNESYTDVPVEEPRMEELVRLDGRPVALRASDPSLIYASLLIHGLFFVPQVRSRIAAWRPIQPPGAQKLIAPRSGPERPLWSLLEAYANMDLAYICELESDRTIEIFGAKRWDASSGPPPRELSRQFLLEIVKSVEQFIVGPGESRLFNFSYSSADPTPLPTSTSESATEISHEGGETTTANVAPDPDTCLVEVDMDIPFTSTCFEDGLISRLSAQLTARGEGQVIIEPSEVVTFLLLRSGVGRGSGSKSNQPLQHPKSIFLDQFLESNAQSARAKRALRADIVNELTRLQGRKGALKWFKGNDTLKNLRSSIYYFENVAQSNGDPERQRVIEMMAKRLNGILAKIEEELVAIDEHMEKLEKEVKGMFDTPDFQQHRYDLRVVLVHDGLFGRRQLYSYVHEKGLWWKVTDNEVLEVAEEIVLNDATGVHLGAGPYMLIYSRALSPEERIQHELENKDWPELLKNTIEHNNDMFLSALSPEVRARFKASGGQKQVAVEEQPQGPDVEIASPAVGASPPRQTNSPMHDQRDV